MTVCILLTCGKHLHDRIISLSGEVWAYSTGLTPPLSIFVIFDYEFFRQCGIFYFHFIYIYIYIDK
jgi:hypothetical protein